MQQLILTKNVETCKIRPQILAILHMKWPWQNGRTLASHARGPGFKSGAGQLFLLLLITSKSDKKSGDQESKQMTSHPCITLFKRKEL